MGLEASPAIAKISAIFRTKKSRGKSHVQELKRLEEKTQHTPKQFAARIKQWKMLGANTRMTLEALSSQNFFAREDNQSIRPNLAHAFRRTNLGLPSLFLQEQQGTLPENFFDFFPILQTMPQATVSRIFNVVKILGFRDVQKATVSFCLTM